MAGLQGGLDNTSPPCESKHPSLSGWDGSHHVISVSARVTTSRAKIINRSRHLSRSNSDPWMSSEVQHTPRGEFSSVQRGGVKSRDQPGRNQKEASGLKGSGVNPLRVMHHSGAAWRARVAVVSTHGRRTIGRATSNFMSQTTNQLTLSGS